MECKKEIIEKIKRKGFFVFIFLHIGGGASAQMHPLSWLCFALENSTWAVGSL